MQHHPVFDCGGEDLDGYNELFSGLSVSEEFLDRNVALYGSRIFAEVRFDCGDIEDGVDRFVESNGKVFIVCDDIEDGISLIDESARKVIHELDMYFSSDLLGSSNDGSDK